MDLLSDETLVFVYGTLKRDEPNYHKMQQTEGGQTARFICEGVTVRSFPLVIGSRFNVPILIDLPGEGQKIFGEVFAVNKEKLAALDEFEGVPHYYTRRTEEILIPGKQPDGTGMEQVYSCEMYYVQNHNPKLLHLPMMDRYSSLASHGLRYLPEENIEDAWDDIHSPETRLPSSAQTPPPWTTDTQSSRTELH